MKKKYIISLIILLSLISLFGNISVLANSWELIEENSQFNAKLVELNKGDKERMSSYTALKYNTVSIGGTIIKSMSGVREDSPLNYDFKQIYNNISNEYKEKNKEYYPKRYLQVVYHGYDDQGNIYLKIYKRKLNSNNVKDIFNHVNLLVSSNKTESKNKSYLLHNGLELQSDENNYNEYKIGASKIVKFSDILIPNLKIITNELDSDINIEIIN